MVSWAVKFLRIVTLTMWIEENNEAMLTNNKKSGGKQNKDCFNVLPTLLLMGKDAKPGVQRHIVRAIDNLSSNSE